MLTLVATACSKDLSKDKAKEILSKQHETHPVAYCGLKNSLLEEKPGIFSASLNDDACVTQLKEIGALTSVGCIKNYSSGGCMTYGFKLGPKTLVEHGTWIECGKRTFGDVTSVTTEGKKATVKFTHVFTLDDTRWKLSACILQPHETGETEASAVFLRDDSGNWTAQ